MVRNPIRSAWNHGYRTYHLYKTIEEARIGAKEQFKTKEAQEHFMAGWASQHNNYYDEDGGPKSKKDYIQENGGGMYGRIMYERWFIKLHKKNELPKNLQDLTLKELRNMLRSATDSKFNHLIETVLEEDKKEAPKDILNALKNFSDIQDWLFEDFIFVGIIKREGNDDYYFKSQETGNHLYVVKEGSTYSIVYGNDKDKEGRKGEYIKPSGKIDKFEKLYKALNVSGIAPLEPKVKISIEEDEEED